MTATAPTLRLQIEPSHSETTLLDGGWWPHTSDPAAELPAIVEAMSGRRGAVSHILLNPSDWDMPHPVQIAVGGHRIRIGWYLAQQNGLITMLCDYGRHRFDLLIVPPATGDAAAAGAMTAAADVGNRSKTPALVAAMQPASLT